MSECINVYHAKQPIARSLLSYTRAVSICPSVCCAGKPTHAIRLSSGNGSMLSIGEYRVNAESSV